MQQLIQRILPFIIVGITLVALFFGLLLLSYLLLFGALIGGILFVINWVKLKWGPKKTPVTKKPSGITIDSDDWKVL